MSWPASQSETDINYQCFFFPFLKSYNHLSGKRRSTTYWSMIHGWCLTRIFFVSFVTLFLLLIPFQRVNVLSLLFLSSGRSSRSYKVVGITLLACVLIAGQAMIAYFLLSQRSDIKSLEEESDNLKSELTKGRSGEEENTFSSDWEGCTDTVGI